VCRRFIADRPNMLWVTDITQRPTRDGNVYCCAVLDVYSRMIVGWSIADHMRAKLVVDALQMACWRRQPPPGTICHRDSGRPIYVLGVRSPAATSRPAGVDRPGGLLGGQHDDRVVLVEMQREPLDTARWETKHQLSQAIFEWIEAWYNPRRRHTSIGNPPVAYEHHAVGDAESAAQRHACGPHRGRRGGRSIKPGFGGCGISPSSPSHRWPYWSGMAPHP
jgi:putative transposase